MSIDLLSDLHASIARTREALLPGYVMESESIHAESVRLQGGGRSIYAYIATVEFRGGRDDDVVTLTSQDPHATLLRLAASVHDHAAP